MSGTLFPKRRGTEEIKSPCGGKEILSWSRMQDLSWNRVCRADRNFLNHCFEQQAKGADFRRCLGAGIGESSGRGRNDIHGGRWHGQIISRGDHDRGVNPGGVPAQRGKCWRSDLHALWPEDSGRLYRLPLVRRDAGSKLPIVREGHASKLDRLSLLRRKVRKTRKEFLEPV